MQMPPIGKWTRPLTPPREPPFLARGSQTGHPSSCWGHHSCAHQRLPRPWSGRFWGQLLRCPSLVHVSLAGQCGLQMRPSQLYRLPSVCAEVAAFASSGGQQCAVSLDCRRVRRAQDLDFNLPACPTLLPTHTAIGAQHRSVLRCGLQGIEWGVIERVPQFPHLKIGAATTPLLVNKEWS